MPEYRSEETRILAYFAQCEVSKMLSRVLLNLYVAFKCILFYSSTMELLRESCKRLKAVNYFRQKPSIIDIW